MSKSLIKGYILVIISAVIYGTMPLMASHIYASGVNSITLTFFRNALSLPFIALIVKLSGKKIKVQTKMIPSIVLISLMGSAVTPLLLLSSYNFMPSGVATVLHFIYPAIVFIIEIIFLKKKIPYTKLLSLILCISGILMFYTPGQKLSLIGSAIALVSGITYAIYVVLLSEFKYKKEVSGFVFGFMVAAVCSVILFFVILFTKQFALPQSLSGWILSFTFAILVNIGAVILFQQGTFLIGGARASILSTFEPVTSVVTGVLFLGEVIGISTLTGTILVILSSILITVFDLKKE